MGSEMKIEVGMFQYSNDLIPIESVYKLAEIFARDFRAVREGSCISDREFGCKRFLKQYLYHDSSRGVREHMEGYVGIHIGLHWDVVLVPYEFAMKVLTFGALPKQINVIDFLTHEIE